MTSENDKQRLYTLDDSVQFSNALRALEVSIKKHLTKDLSLEEDEKGKKVPRTLSSLRREHSLASSAKMPNRIDKVIVFTKIVILKLGDIDTMRDKFSADVFIQCKWREPALDGKFKSQKDPINWELYWNPRLSLENVIGEPKEQIWHTLTFDNFGQAIICEKRRVTGAFLEFMELYQFPFDTQDLSVSVISDRDQSELELIEDPKEKCLLNVMSFADVQEWKLHDGCTTWKEVKEESFNTTKKHPAFGASCKVSRRPQFFFWNIFVIMTLICSLSFATFSVSFTLPQNRLQLTFILLLTTVSFKFVANQNLPSISYLTYLDRYILGLMGILTVICVWHAIVFFIYTSTKCNQSLVGNLDNIAAGIFGSIYILFHLAFIFTVACVKKDSAGHGNEPVCSDDMTFDEDCTDDYSLPNQDLGDSGPGLAAATHADNSDNNQAVIAACGFE
ncbi:hypothetical protein HELRODRAFT_189241 [Helobdella robusta]|uniref:Neurotransmitter-gated ion-channel ligand-binding domain-containing protein n=1 Tax=Helobdella robusta TaxID=6412 RepID=T1FQU8_HELRO|nr:hypothetical protein HELRODRAFT_189241 [Helobdella robusta]ESN96441.1 hypothetical protein HELRODRAFT_189241 [Helobdella robusta]